MAKFSTIEVPGLQPLLPSAYGAFEEMIKHDSAIWGPSERAVGATSADSKQYTDIGKHELPGAPPAICALYWVLLKALDTNIFGLGSALGIGLKDLADLAAGPVLRMSQYYGGGNVLNHPHSDIDLVTLLPSATAGGLQILEEGVWREARIPANCVGVLIGELAQEFGGEAPTTHRVLSSGSERMSASFFINARPELIVRDGTTVGELMRRRFEALRFA